jgi:NADH dehydrogenase FAD-containing subunit
VLPDHAPEARADAVGILRALGVDVIEEVRVEGVEPDAVHLTDGRAFPGRAVWCGGFVPARIAEDADLAAGARGEILVDGTLRSRTDARIFAAGDVARVEGQAHLRMGCVTAMPMGAHAAGSILAALHGRDAADFQFRFLLQCVSLGRRQGLVQRTDPFDRPLPRFYRGRSGAFIKEQINRFTVRALEWEQRLPGIYRWPRPPGAAARSPRERFSGAGS